ncbi:MAG: 4Fe-4S dicluster domain-containing protein [Chloroflexi bacterium]|nr:4Fe-4S dicluster domain-containing protein [Chloroflexota bacterium]
MKQLVILSGKGGTGKTTVAAALAHLASREMPIVLADADVDAANLELVLSPEVQETHDFVGGKLAIIDPDLCTACGICAEVCRFEAVVPPSPPPPHPPSPSPNLGRGGGGRRGERVRAYAIDPIACEGCASCFYQCPAGAIRMEEQVAGRWFHSDTRFGPLFHAHLFAAQENSGKLVTLVKQQGRLRALDEGRELLIVDGPPGIGCPVIAASAGADLALLVVEPTVSGVHDLERILTTTNHFGVPALVCINKADINPRRAKEIAAFCATQGIALVGQVPFDTVVTEAMVQGLPVTAFSDGLVSRALRCIWARTREVLRP